ncbi:sigma-54-dependent transcriptional regulator [Clostridium sp. BJN0001]|uniref:sigma 54-interacting transcriptional regulator n=1 Tax=Clostridium sp. BJN0001 TaxID=2930219 RepID=UPI001FD349E3|nr:sigma-54-dependent transcriptional regulator [Clostridium sp. BJN0001]
MKKIDTVYETIKELFKENENGITADKIADKMQMQRTNASSYLNLLCKQKKLEKINSRPVLFKPILENNNVSYKRKTDVFNIIGYDKSLKGAVQQAKAAIIYPPDGLNTLITGPTGVGKSMFAYLMYKYALECKQLNENSPFVTFNCADYSNNPQLLMSELFGVEKGAYTGAEKEKEGLLKKTDGGILFLDEIHRLPPEGQEMLFTFIDKGTFRKLGSTSEISVKVRIIAATTENPKSALLDTFTRRIPMMIKLPSLNERTVYERKELVDSFLSKEAKTINESIYVDKSTMKSLLIYKCSNNIGQLKSDIKTACAESFLQYKKNTNTKFKLKIDDFNNNIKNGLTYNNGNNEQVNTLLKNIDYIRFNKDLSITNIYNDRNLKNEIYNLSDVNKLSVIEEDIDTYMDKFHSDINIKHIKELFGEEIFTVVVKISELVKNELDRSFSNRVLLGFAVHIKNVIEKVKQGREITNPQLNDIRIKMPKEFKVSVAIIQIIEDKFNIQIPLDEIGYIALFLKDNIVSSNEFYKSKNVKVILCFHGESTAKSMKNFVNGILKTDIVDAVDMNINVKPNIVYKEIEDLIRKENIKNILLMVDMGSLTTFDSKLKRNINGLNIKTIEMSSTPMVIEAAQKAQMGMTLEEIYNTVVDTNPYLGKRIIGDIERNVNRNLIVIVHFSEDERNVNIKATLCKNINMDNYKTEVISIYSENVDECFKTIHNLEKHRNIIAIIAMTNPEIYSIPFIKTDDIFTKAAIQKIENIMRIENFYIEMSDSLKNHLINLEPYKLISDLKVFIDNITKKLDIPQEPNIIIGCVLHLCFMIDQIISGKRDRKLKNKDKIRKKYFYEYNVIKEELKFIEDKYDIHISDDEICAIIIIILEIEDI